MTSFSSRLRELRKSRNLTQGDLAQVLKVTKSAISMYEGGKREPDHEMTELLADYFNVDVDYLLGRSDVTTRFIRPGQEWYDDATIRATADRIRANKKSRALFDAAVKIPDSDIDFVVEVIRRITK